jgi:hypothetical protein
MMQRIVERMMSLSPVNLLVLLIVLALFIMTAKEARKKGYRPLLWFFAGGLIGLLIVTAFPFVNEKSNLTEEKRKTWRIVGNVLGGLISALGLLGIAASLIAR